MSYRVDHHWEALKEHLEHREWTQNDIAQLRHLIGHSALISSEGALELLELQQEIDERIVAEGQHDNVFNSQHLPTTYQQPDGRWDVC